MRTVNSLKINQISHYISKMDLKKLLLLILLLPGVFCQPQTVEHTHAVISCYVILLLVLLGAIIHYFLKIVHLKTLHGVVLILMGILVNLLVKYTEILSFESIITTKGFIMYIPFALFGIAIHLNVYFFLRSWHQILIISLPATIVDVCLVGFAMKVLIGKNWSALDALYFGIMVHPIYPVEILSYLKNCGKNVREISTLLEGETLVGGSVIVLLADMYFMHENGKDWSSVAVHVVTERTFEVILGFILGFAGSYLMRFSSQDPLNIVVISIGFVSFATFVSGFLNVNGIVAATIVAVMISNAKSALPVPSAEYLKSVWKVITYVMNSFFLIYCGIIITSKVMHDIKLRDIALTFASFLIVNISRFLSIMIFVPILSRMGNGLTFRHMMVCVWSGLKSPYVFMLGIKMVDEMAPKFEYEVHAITVFLWTYLVNGTTLPILLRFLGYSELSTVKQANMNVCLKYVESTRASVVGVLRMDRFFADANWSLVQKATTMKHPYKSNNTDEAEDEKEDLGTRKTTKCPQCQKDVVHEPSASEYKEMLHEARLRVLKAKKISYSRQFEMGMLRRDALHSLIQAVEIAMDSKEALIDFGNVEKLFKKENVFYRCLKKSILRKYVEKYQSTKAQSRMPNTVFRQYCNRIMSHWFYDLLMINVILVNVLFVYLEYLYPRDGSKILGINMEWALYSGMLCGLFMAFFLFYALEFALKIFGCSWVTIKDGFKTYFKSLWNYFDLALLAINLVVVGIYFMELEALRNGNPPLYHNPIFIGTFKFLLTLRVIKVIHLLIIMYPKMMQLADHHNDRYRQYVFDVGMGYLVANSEILETLSNMIDNSKILNDTRYRMERDRLTLIRLLVHYQRQRPWIGITVQTKQSAKTVLNNMREAVNELKVAGWVDDTEYLTLWKALMLREDRVELMPLVDPCSPKQLFMNVPWITASPENVREYLYKNVQVMKYDPGDCVCYDGQSSEGIYIVVDGLFFLTYIPHPNDLQLLRNFGCLPIVDYMPMKFYYGPYYDYIMNGNFIGEFCTLTSRPYNCTISAEIYSHVFLLKNKVLKKAMEMNADPVRGLECQLWRSVSQPIAISVLLQVTTYQSMTHEKLRFLLERSFVPNLSNYKFFVINHMIEDLVIIEGVAKDDNTNKMYTAPCYVPRSVQKLLLPHSSKIDFNTNVETKLLVIPAASVDEYEVMEMEMEMCELVDTDSATRLRHLTAANLRQRQARIRASNVKTRFAMIEEKSSRSSKSTDSRTSSRSFQLDHDQRAK